jgi:hypothetical protein
MYTILFAVASMSTVSKTPLDYVVLSRYTYCRIDQCDIYNICIRINGYILYSCNWLYGIDTKKLLPYLSEMLKMSIAPLGDGEFGDGKVGGQQDGTLGDSRL